MIIKIDKKTLSSYSYLSKKKVENQKTKIFIHEKSYKGTVPRKYQYLIISSLTGK